MSQFAINPQNISELVLPDNAGTETHNVVSMKKTKSLRSDMPQVMQDLLIPNL